jgi:energy-coupling factor transporter transmembrane protein EcfT
METHNIVFLAISIILFIIMLIFLFLILYDKKINVYIKWSVLIVSIILLIFSLYNTHEYWLKNRNDNFDIIEVCGNDKLCREINQLLDTMEDNIYDPDIYEPYKKIVQLFFDNNENSKLNSIKIEKPLYWDLLKNKFNKIKNLVTSGKQGQTYDIEDFPKGILEVIE